MSLSFAILVFGLVLTFSPDASWSMGKEQAFRECNVTNPVQRNPRSIIINGIVSGDRIELSEEEKCHLYCFLQKVHFFDKDGNIRGNAVVKFARRNYKVAEKHNDVLISQIFNVIRWTRGEPDKCQKAMIAFFRFNDYMFLWATAEGERKIKGDKNKVIEAAYKNQSMPAEIQKEIIRFLKRGDVMSGIYQPIHLKNENKTN